MDYRRRPINNQLEEEEPRVTDRRRVRIDGDGQAAATAPAEEVNLKPSYVEELEARNKAAEQKLLEVQSRFDQLRTELQRETDQTRQRLNKAADERAERQKLDFIASLLPVLDNLQRAIDAVEKGSSSEAVLAGLEQTKSSFESALTSVGAEPIPAVGEVFDPQLHDAVDILPVEQPLDGTITKEYARGFRVGERLLRPARVQVGRAV